MQTRKMWLLFFGVKGVILLAPLSFVMVHYMVTGTGQASGSALDTFESGLTKLMHATQQGNLANVQSLVAAGADLDMQSTHIAPNYRNPDGSFRIDGSTALHMACALIDSAAAQQIVRFLVNAGANVRIKNRAHSETPLHYLFRFTKTLDKTFLNPFIEILVKNGANINAQNADGETVSHIAVYQMRPDWLDVLLKGQFSSLVDRSIKNNAGLTPADVAKKWHSEFLQSFGEPQRFELAQRNALGLTGLMIAVINGNTEIVRTVPIGSPVLDEKTFEQGQDKYGYTALELALLHQRIDMVKELMDRGAHPDVVDARGNAPIHLIYKLSSMNERIKVLNALATKANFNIQDAQGNTLMHHAVMRNDEVMVRFLLEKYREKIDLQVQNKKTDTPALLAQRLGRTHLMLILG